MADLNIYLARGMDARDPAEVLLDDQCYQSLFKRIGAVLMNPFSVENPTNRDFGVIAETDLKTLKNADLLLADLSLPDYQYVGCIFEIVHASLTNIPIVLVVGNRDWHRVFLNAFCEFIAKTPEDATRYIQRVHTTAGLAQQMADTQAYYEAAAADYSKISTEPEGIDDGALIDAFSDERRELRDVLVRYVKGRVCEVGSGTGDWTRTISEHASEVLALDTSRAMLKIARKNLQRCDAVSFYHFDILNGPLDCGRFDTVVLYFFLSILPPCKQTLLLERLDQLLKPDGLLIVADTKRFSTHESIGIGRRRLEMRIIDQHKYVLYKEHFAAATLKRLLQCQYDVLESSGDNLWFSWVIARRSKE